MRGSWASPPSKSSRIKYSREKKEKQWCMSFDEPDTPVTYLSRPDLTEIYLCINSRLTKQDYNPKCGEENDTGKAEKPS